MGTLRKELTLDQQFLLGVSRWLAVLLALLSVCSAWAAADERPRGGASAAKRDVQERAREQARGVVARLLDVQLQTLEENKLQGLPLYRDIKDMRASIHA